MSLNTFITMLNTEYGREYDLSKSKFLGMKKDIDIICPDHGIFTTTPHNLIYNAGCPKCRGVHYRGYPTRRGKGDNPKKRPGPVPRITVVYFYIVKLTDTTIKFGTTINSNALEYELIFKKRFNDRQLANAVKRSLNVVFKSDIDIKHLKQIIRIVNSYPYRSL